MRKSSCLALLLLAAPAAFAQDNPPPGSPPPGTTASMRHHESVWTLDANHDGMLSRDEVQSRPGLAKHFDQIDANHDGQIDRNEWRAWHQQMKVKHQARMQQQQGTAPASQPTQPPPDEDSTG